MVAGPLLTACLHARGDALLPALMSLPSWAQRARREGRRELCAQVSMQVCLLQEDGGPGGGDWGTPPVQQQSGRLQFGPGTAQPQAEVLCLWHRCTSEFSA